MDFDSRVKFRPHVGTLYKRSPIKLLILGESHYSWESRPKDPEVTKIAVGDGGYRFHRAICKLFNSPAGFWKSVAFYNYVQCFVGDRARQRPTAEMWADSHEPFGIILKRLQPDRILVIGKTTWLRMAGESQDYAGCKTIAERGFKLGPNFSEENADCAYWYQTSSAKFALAAPVYHPAYPHGFHFKEEGSEETESEKIVKKLMDPGWKFPA